MAWTTKSDRFGGTASPSTTGAQHLGPGHYKVDKGYGCEHGYAPFGSTDPKAAADKDGRASGGGNGPPPGTYDPKLPGKYDPGLPKKHVPFGGSAMRIDLRAKAKTDFRPGPGTYAIDPGLPAPQGTRTMGIIPDIRSVIKSSSAPSIPQSHQSYGYEEVGGGRLVRQGPKDGSLFSSGRPGDSAGPGQYEPVHDAIRPRQCNGSFLKGPARVPLDGNFPGESPGPGHYAKPSSLEINTNSYVGGASFASGSDRGAGKRELKRLAECPGPGTYANADSKRPDLRELRSELQYFGSTVERFKAGPGTKGSVPDAIGPGTYSKHLARKMEPPNARGFCTTQVRFGGEGEVKQGMTAPGPGQYEVAGISEDTMSGPLATFSMLGNSGGLAFGAMAKRLNTYEKDDQPGPGYYRVPGMSDDAEGDSIPEADSKSRSRKPQRSRLPGAAFASKTPKDASTKSSIKEGLQKPPPGAYDPVLVKDQATVVRLRSKSEGFLSAANRFAGGPLDAPKGYKLNTGPGKYSPQDITGGKRLNTFNRSICEGMPESGRPKGLGFESQDKRFRPGHSEKGPGPGSYQCDPKWITKSHNCYFGDLV